MKWHPLVIKWSLYLRHLSGKAYELLRKTGYIKLPSQRTLHDYTHYIPPTIADCWCSLDSQSQLKSPDVSHTQGQFLCVLHRVLKRHI